MAAKAGVQAAIPAPEPGQCCDRPRTARPVRAASALLSLLTLENVHDFGSVKAAHFAESDPASPQVEETCLLKEARAAALSEMPEPPGIDAVQLREAGYV